MIRKHLSRAAILYAAFLGLGNANRAVAENIAVVIAGEGVDQSEVIAIADRVERRGYRILSSFRPSSGELREIAAVMSEAHIFGSGQRIAILLGNFAKTRNEIFFLSRNTQLGAPSALFATGLPLSAVFDFTETAPADSAILLGHDFPLSVDARSLLDQQTPQGTAVITGPLHQMVSFSINNLLETADSLPKKVGAFEELTISGFVAPRVAFPVSEIALQVEASDLRKEATLWEIVKSVDGFEAYKLYLDAYPEGRWHREARAQFQQLQQKEIRDAAEIEASLKMSREQRIQIQNTLNRLQLKTNGVEGVFGPVTRGSIAEWQRNSGYRATGYLTAEQYLALVAIRLNASSPAESDSPKKHSNLQDSIFSDNSLAFLRRVRLTEEMKLSLPRETYLAIEHSLEDNGFLNAIPDGVFDVETRIALRAFQDAKGLEPTGYLNNDTVAAFALDQDAVKSDTLSGEN